MLYLPGATTAGLFGCVWPCATRPKKHAALDLEVIRVILTCCGPSILTWRLDAFVLLKMYFEVPMNFDLINQMLYSMLGSGFFYFCTMWKISRITLFCFLNIFSFSYRTGRMFLLSLTTRSSWSFITRWVLITFPYNIVVIIASPPNNSVELPNLFLGDTPRPPYLPQQIPTQIDDWLHCSLEHCKQATQGTQDHPKCKSRKELNQEL